LNYALIESYHESLPKGRYPLAFVFFDCDPAAVDVNVHPSKREVRFRSEPTVRAFVIRSVLDRLRQQTAPLVSPSTPVPARNSSSATAYPATVPTSSFPPPRLGSAGGDSGISGRTVAAMSTLPSPRADTNESAQPSAVEVAAAPASRSPQVNWRFVGMAHGSYALFETAAGLVLLDRRAAHERVWFERLQEQFRSGDVPRQRLLLAIPVELDPIMSALLLDRLQFLNAHGFEIVEFGRNFFRIEAVPSWMEPADAEPLLRDLLGAIREGRMPDRDAGLAREELARLAVSKAVRLPISTGETELRALVGSLFETRSPLTSPAGRPTYIELHHGELARRFQK
jgi:DNA mismatch repair protein MutL